MGLRTAVYTAIAGDRDCLRHTMRAVPTEPCLAFLDWPAPDPYLGWRTHRIEANGYRPKLAAKQYQILAHRYVDAEVSLYLDGTHTLTPGITVADLADEYLRYSDVAVFEHGNRDCAYLEAEACIEKAMDDPEVIRAQVARYRGYGFPEHAGLPALTMILRRHTPKMATFNEMWWQEVLRGSSRDQISFPFVAWAEGLHWETIPGCAFSHPMLTYVPHGLHTSEGGYLDVSVRY